MKDKIKVGIIGHTGRLGKPLCDILKNHSRAEIVYTESTSAGASGNLGEAEFIFLALPYGESKHYLNKLKDKKVIDLSVDHRNDSDWIYGLPEINKEKIKNARRVANPGCYATSILLGLLPLKNEIKNIRIQATSGISGAGESVKEEDNFVIYKEHNNHPQIPEIKNLLRIDSVTFIPMKIETADRGIVSTIFAEYRGTKNARDIFIDFYKKSPFVKIVDTIETKNVVGTNCCHIKPMQTDNGIVIITALDNLLKGGAGQAVQNFNIMNGFAGDMGLRWVEDVEHV
jgi:N-acetyl-gamma-glutamyl-phosphate reductase